MVFFSINGFEKKLSYIDKYIGLSSFRFDFYKQQILNKRIKFNNLKKKIYFFRYIKHKYLKFVYYIYNGYKKNNDIIFNNNIINMFFYFIMYVKYLKFINYILYIDTVNFTKKNQKVTNLPLKLLEESIEEFVNSLFDINLKKNKNKIISSIFKHFKTNKRVFFIKNSKQSFYKKFVKNSLISSDNLCDNLGVILINNIYNFKFSISLLVNKLVLNNEKLNIFKSNIDIKKKISLNLNIFYRNIFKNDILGIKSFSYIESKLMLFCVIIFYELIFFLIGYISFFKIEFNNILIQFLYIINLHKIELFHFLEIMCINSFNKDFFNYQSLIISIIKQFLNDKNFIVYFLTKYYNIFISDIINYVILEDFSELIEIFMSAYHKNTYLNIINISINFIKNSCKNFISIKNRYPANKVLNFNYYFNSILFINNFFLETIISYKKKIIPNTNIDDNLDLIRQTPLKLKDSMEMLSSLIQNLPKRGRPRNLTIYQKGILIAEGVLEPEKPLTKKELYELEWGVPYKFAQENKKYMENLFNYVSNREKNYKIKQIKLNKNSEMFCKKYYIKNLKIFSDNEPIIFSEESIKLAYKFRSELMEGFKNKKMDKIKNKKSEIIQIDDNGNNILKKRRGRPFKILGTIKKCVSMGRLKTRKYYVV